MSAEASRDETRQRYILWVGLSLYAGSFILVDVGGTDPGRGYVSAWITFVLPWGGNLFGHQGIFEHKKFEYLSLLLSGWINPIFLITCFWYFADRNDEWSRS